MGSVGSQEPPPTEAARLPFEPSTGVMLAGRYRLTGRVGRGGMADVYAADDELLHRQVAIKLFRVDTPAAADRRRIEAEMLTLASLRHPGLVTVFDAGTYESPDATPFLVLELVRGPNLAGRLATGPLSSAETGRIGAQLAGTLAYIHAEAVVHRDVKPANVLLDSHTADELPHAKLTDFGIATMTDATRLTEVGLTVGTANYLSPEQACAEPVGPASDVYSLALVLLECLTGELAFPGSGYEAALARLHRDPVIPASLGPSWVALLTAATDRDPDRRPTAAALAQQLQGLAADAPTEPAVDALAPTAATRIPAPAAPTGGGSTPWFFRDHRAPADPQPGRADRPDLDRQPAAARPPRTRHRPGRRSVLAGAALLAVALLASGALLLFSHHNSSQASTPPPSYPTAPGTLGQHLRGLEEVVG